MKKVLAAAFAFLLLPVYPTLAQDHGFTDFVTTAPPLNTPAASDKIPIIEGGETRAVTPPNLLTGAGNVELAVANNTALKALAGTTVASVRRNGFATAGDGGAARYVWNASNCVTADDGAQVQPSGTGCWIADFSGAVPTPKVWGAVGDGTTNDTTKVQAAITAMASTTLASAQKKLRVVDHPYCVTALTIPTGITIEGSGPPVAATETNSGLKACSTNASLITVSGNGSKISGLVINGNGGNTSGFAIKITGHENRIENNHINGFCTYIYNIGRHNIINGNVLTDNVNPTNSSGCSVIIDGDATAATVGSVYMNNLLTTWGPNAAGSYHAGMLFQNSGGPYIAFNDIQRTSYGTIIKPLADKTVSFAFFDSTVLGDTTNADGLFIDTTNSNSRAEIIKINNSYFGRNGDWPGTFTWAAARNVTIQNTGLGAVSGVHINGTAFNTASNENIAIVGNSGVNDITIDNSTLCFPGQGTNSANILLNDASTLAIRNNTIGAACNQVVFSNTTTTANIFFNTANSGNLTITGNQLYGPWQLGAGPIADAGSAIVSTGLNTISNNYPLDSSPLTVTSAAAIDPGYYPVVYITGTTNVTNIRHPWQGRKITVYTPGGFTFTTGGGGSDAICGNKTMAAGATATAVYLPVTNCWAFQ